MFGLSGNGAQCDDDSIAGAIAFGRYDANSLFDEEGDVFLTEHQHLVVVGLTHSVNVWLHVWYQVAGVDGDSLVCIGFGVRPRREVDLCQLMSRFATTSVLAATTWDTACFPQFLGEWRKYSAFCLRRR